MAVKTYFISGFLGAGKTTLLNNLMRELAHKKIGIILNEFGKVNIDAELIDHDQGREISEINNGSIFCTCLAGSFVQKIVEYSKLPLDYLLVESSGMARPSSIGTILDQVNDLCGKLNTGGIDYRGMITIVDATNYLKLVETVNAVREQVAYSDLLIINKIDLVEESRLKKIEERIHKLNPSADVLNTKYCQFGGLLNGSYYLGRYRERQSLLNCQADRGMYKALLKFEGMVLEDELLSFLDKLVEKTYRIKGFIQLDDDRFVRVDCSDNRRIVNKSPRDLQLKESQLVIINDNSELKAIIRDVWNEIGLPVKVTVE